MLVGDPGFVQLDPCRGTDDKTRSIFIMDQDYSRFAKFLSLHVLWSVAKLDGGYPMGFFEILNFGDMGLRAPEELDARRTLFEKP